jgi:hypothetical protein
LTPPAPAAKAVAKLELEEQRSSRWAPDKAITSGRTMIEQMKAFPFADSL